MDIEKMKNIVVLKNIPSNMIEEAFVVLKDNVKIHKEECVGNSKLIDKKDERAKDSNYVVKEAELIVSEYIRKLEKKDNKDNKETKKLKERCKKLKYATILLGVISFFSVVTILCKVAG